MRMPETLARVNRALQERGITSFDDFHLSLQVLRDDEKGPFLRLHFSLANGDYFTIDSTECASMLEPPVMH